jgi:thioredoxin-dependent peroxiredoxin
MIRSISVAALCTPLAALLLFPQGLAAADVPKEGDAAPAVSLPAQDGKTVQLSDFAGKWIVLYFYPKDMTRGCTIEAHNFQRDLQKYTDANAVILGVSVDSTESHTEFCTKESLTFHLLSDPDHKVVDAYGSFKNPPGFAMRNTFLIDPQGAIAKVWTGVDPTHHSDDVLAELAALQKK